jgi:protease I
MPKRILIVTDDAGECFEILYARQRFTEAGWRAVVAAPRRKRLHGVIHDFEPGWNTYIEKPGYGIDCDLSFAQVRPRDYAAAVLIGGRAPEHLRYDARLLRVVREMHRQGKWIFAICHGIQILIAAGLVRGRRLTCYRNVRSELTQAGARWVDRPSVRDGRFVTAQTWESHPEFYRDIFAALAEK